MLHRVAAATLAACALLAPAPASALSCVPHDAAATFQRIHGAPDIYIGVTGTLTFDEDRLPVVDRDNQETTPPETPIPARMTGHSLSAEGFETPFDRRIMLKVQCAGPWCAGVSSGTRYMGFLKAEDGGYSLTIGPCGGDAFAAPTPAMMETVRQCFAGGSCVPNND